MKDMPSLRTYVFVGLLWYSLAAAKGTWPEQQSYAEAETAKYLAAYPSVQSDTLVVKQVELPDGSELTLDLRIERPKTGGPFPVVFFVHGGGWITGSKAHFCHQSFELANRGIAGVRLEYRWKSHGAKYPEAIDDIMDAIAMIRERAGELDLDFTRVGLAGGSAGGHLSAIAAQLTPECIAYYGYNGLYDAYDRGRSHFGSCDYTGTSSEDRKNASALYNLKDIPPRTLLFHGTEDQVIDIDVARRFAEAIQAKQGAKADLLIYEGVGHGFFAQEPYRSTTTLALLEHASFVFGLSDKRPTLTDYKLPANITEQPDGFILTGKWRSKNGQTIEFFEDNTVKYSSGQILDWTENFGRLYVIWKSGHYGAITTSEASSIQIGNQVFHKEGANPAVTPVAREPKDWLLKRHRGIQNELERRDLSKVDIVFIGDSITQGWLGKGRVFWNNSFPYALNLGVSGDRTEHILYRLIKKSEGGTMGHLDDPRINPRFIVLMIGTNNVFRHSADQIILGVEAVHERLCELEPQATIILCSILPTAYNDRNSSIVVPVNEAIRNIDRIRWLDLYTPMVDAQGLQRKDFFQDKVHLDTRGYELWHERLIEVMKGTP